MSKNDSYSVYQNIYGKEKKKSVASEAVKQKAAEMLARPEVQAYREMAIYDHDLEQLASPIEILPAEISKLATTLHQRFETDQVDMMVDDIVIGIRQSIIGPFGLGPLLKGVDVLGASDKVGGNVDTVHNVRQGIYATTEEEQAYDNRASYSSHEVHGDERYIATNKAQSDSQEAGSSKDAYTGKDIPAKQNIDNKRDKRQLDHTVSAKETHDDAGRVLAEIPTEELANRDENLNSTTAVVNQSKGQKPVHATKRNQKQIEEFLKYNDDKGKNTREAYQAAKSKQADGTPLNQNDQDVINKVENNKGFLEHLQNVEERKAHLEQKVQSGETLTEKEQDELDKCNKLLEVDQDALEEKDEAARQDQDNEINRTYYTSSKFIKNTLKTSAGEGAKMGFQQAVGFLLDELFCQIVWEASDWWKNRKSVDGFLKEFKVRAGRIAENLIQKWDQFFVQFGKGFLSGFISNLVTVIINTFFTTAKRLVRVIREGFFSLMKAVSVILFPPEGMTFAQASHEGLKLLFGTGILVGGILLEEVVEDMIMAIPLLGAISSFVSPVIIGALTAICASFTAYFIDQIDLFGVVRDKKEEYVLDCLKYEQKAAIEACDTVIEELDALMCEA